jgi:nucleoside-diphosphate kinase
LCRNSADRVRHGHWKKQFDFLENNGHQRPNSDSTIQVAVNKQMTSKGEDDMERTLSIIKPDGVQKNVMGEVIKRFEAAGIRIVAMKTVKLSRDQAKAFYLVHKERPFYDSLTEFMSSGRIVAMVLEGENVIQRNRDLMGATNYKEAAPGTIRHDYASDIEKNIVHGSDGPATAATEIAFFFNSLEICS